MLTSFILLEFCPHQWLKVFCFPLPFLLVGGLYVHLLKECKCWLVSHWLNLGEWGNRPRRAWLHFPRHQAQGCWCKVPCESQAWVLDKLQRHTLSILLWNSVWNQYPSHRTWRRLGGWQGCFWHFRSISAVPKGGGLALFKPTWCWAGGAWALLFRYSGAVLIHESEWEERRSDTLGLRSGLAGPVLIHWIDL